MKFKSFAIMAATCMFLFASTAQAAMTLRVIGRSPFYQPPLTSVEDLKVMVRTTKSDVKRGFALTPDADLFPAFINQIFTADIETFAFEKGTKFEWMLFKDKKSGKVRVAKDVTWGGKKPFPGYKFFIDSEGKRYTFAVPAGCGNIALIGVKSTPPAIVLPPVVVAPPPPPVNQPPGCNVVVSPVSSLAGETVNVDASSSTDADGTIDKMNIAFVDAQGQVISEKSVEGGVLQADVEMAQGNNTLRVTLTDNDGDESTSSECNVDVSGISRVRFLADVGYYRQYDPANYLFARVGLEYKINEQFSFLGLIGGAPQVEGIDGKSAFLIDALGEYSWSRYYVDFGVGGWITDGDSDLKTENSQLDLIVAAGARVYGEPDEFNASLFVEVRSGVEELDGLADYGRFGLGVRFRF